MKIEDVMAQAAYSQITEAMPSIREHLLGFEVIDSDEDENRGLGVLLAKLGDTYIFIPSIYRNGRICDMDLLYDPANNRFLPVQDNTFSYLMSKKTDISGQPVPPPTTSRAGRTGGPGGVSLNLPFSMFSKVASAERGCSFHELHKIAGDMLAAIILDRDGQIENVAEGLNGLEAPQLAKMAGAALSEAILNKLDTPGGWNAFAQYYGKEDMDKLVDILVDTVAINRVKKEIAEKTPQETPVKVLTAASSEAKNLSDAEKASILRDGAVIVDNRGLLPSQIFKLKQNNEWQGAQHNGMYELLRLDGSTITAYVINLNGALGFDKFNTTKEDFAVIPVDDGMSREIHRIDFAPVGQYYPMDCAIPLGGKDVSKLSSDDFGHYGEMVILTPKGEALRIQAIDGVNSGHWLNTDEEKFVGIKARVSALDQYDGIGRDDISNGAKDYITAEIEQKLSPMPMVGSQNEAITQITVGKPNSIMRISGNNLRVPEGSKFYSLDGWNNKRNDLDLVDQSNAIEAIAEREKLTAVTIYNADGLVTLSDKMMKKASGSKIDVAQALVTNYVVAPKTAMNLVKEACAKAGGETFLIKIADSSQFGMTFQQEEPAVVDYFESEALSPMTSEKINDQEVLERAAQSGVQQVLDVELLKLMAEDDGSAREIRSYIPKLLAAVDALGRLLFLTRVNDSMHEAYGDQRIMLMEKSIKSAFVKVWDIILGLQQGQVDNVSDLISGDLSKSIG